MARAAGFMSNPNKIIKKLRNVIWLQPIKLSDKPREIVISLNKTNNTSINFEIYSYKSENSNEHVMHSQGIIDVEEPSENAELFLNLNEIQAKNDENFKLIINSYKFRLIQLCKTHLRDGYITESDFEQITEMYKLYHGLGGNGQAQEYYDKVLELDIKKDNDIQ
jgi:hypothetical protein